MTFLPLNVAYRAYQIKLAWHQPKPIQYSEYLALASFEIGGNMIRPKCEHSYLTGNFSCLEGLFLLNRNIGYYMFHCYIPSLLCVAISWLSFWVKLEIAPARVTLGIATFFTISQQTQTFNQGLPKVSYIKAIDIWMMTCNLFVFATLLEYCIAQVNFSFQLLNGFIMFYSYSCGWKLQLRLRKKV